MADANLKGAEMYGVKLAGTNMEGAVLDWAKLSQNNLRRAKKAGAVLHGTNQ